MSKGNSKESESANGRRKKPGAGGEGDFYHIEIRSSEEFETFRTQDVGEKGGLERVAGKRKDGTWDTVKWLFSKDLAHVENGKLVPDHKDAKELFDDLGSQPVKVEGDRYSAKNREK
ncbi:MAG: hypothetical protein KDB79_14540 [Acidobacteria bacterium]|nr:hypothetical protein [Acidobacteriota bacterium]